jgi:hypothetical protein
MEKANQIPLIYNLLNNMNSNFNVMLDENFSLNNQNMSEISTTHYKLDNNFNLLFYKNIINETAEIFESLKKNDIMCCIQANIFSNFNPNWSYFARDENNESFITRDNIYNTFIKISKIYKMIKSQGKIIENSKCKIKLNFSICKCT